MTKKAAECRVTITVNAQQLDFIERMRREHYSDLSVAEMARRALDEMETDEAGHLRLREKPC